MIRTLDTITANDLAHVQRGKAMRTAVLQRRDISIRLAEKHDRLLQDRAAEQLTFGEIVRPSGDVPGVAQIGSAEHFFLAVEKLGSGLCRACHRSTSFGNYREVGRM